MGIIKPLMNGPFSTRLVCFILKLVKNPSLCSIPSDLFMPFPVKLIIGTPATHINPTDILLF